MDPSRSSPRILSLKIQFACTASLFDVLTFGLTGEGEETVVYHPLPEVIHSLVCTWAVD